MPDLAANYSASFVIGACCFLSVPAITSLGLFDSRFFLYSEECDFQKRAHDLGFSSELLLSPKVIHLSGGSSSSDLNRNREVVKSRFLYYEKWFGGFWAILDATFLFFGHLWRCLLTKGNKRRRHFSTSVALIELIRGEVFKLLTERFKRYTRAKSKVSENS